VAAPGAEGIKRRQRDLLPALRPAEPINRQVREAAKFVRELSARMVGALCQHTTHAETRYTEKHHALALARSSRSNRST